MANLTIGRPTGGSIFHLLGLRAVCRSSSGIYYLSFWLRFEGPVDGGEC